MSLHRFTAFLKELCRERNISLVDDRIVTVESDDDRIQAVHSETDTYEADLYVDATGFERLLIGAVSDSFRSFEIPLDTAVQATADLDIRDIHPATVVETGEYGWFWQIDTIDNRDLGYVFASEYISTEDAIAEFESHRDESFLDLEVYRFDSGFHDQVWVGNCLASGNAAGFIEPLQSTALTSNLAAAVRVSQLLASHCRVNDRGLRQSVNAYTRGLWNSIYDFISLHYRFASGENDFWREMQSIPLSEKATRYIAYYEDNGLEVHDSELINDDGSHADMVTFPTSSMYLIMRHMGATSRFYEEHDIDVSAEVVEKWEQRNAFVERAAEECLTYQQVYESGLVESYRRDERAYARAGGSARRSR